MSSNNFWQEQAKKGTIIALAPMDGYTDSAYRQIVKTINPNVICFTEFFSADGIVHSKTLAKEVLPHATIEKPLIVQIFGKDPEMFKKAAIIIEQFGVAGIDINMGCPAKKVVKSGHGSSLMINTETAFKIIEEMAKSVKIPISVKTRLGRENWENLVEFSLGLQNAGAKLITVHGRTYKQGFSGNADWTGIYELRKQLKIPVIGNGDVTDYDDGMKKLQNLDGFMIGRSSFGNPWSFFPGVYKPTLDEILTVMRQHTQFSLKTKGDKKGILDMRKHFVQYLHSFPGVKEFRKRLVLVNSLEELDEIIGKIGKLVDFRA
ncbi:MAG: tRNA-dihydrouridine synthase family protein [Candidatus Gracilibacteria bacterium]|nr:tRNA-dihydrouridine synthase family protein [Candidatus Gracilibacteria bacterium]MDD3120593.1 tRNA-dihydrouridine synthase family protein [Candidatus Gracilibacteria bacterium]MDD4530580.1 tRNA-dihydrouridine synthase family protein [Candidatus Gracilibacteria bacterium]